LDLDRRREEVHANFGFVESGEVVGLFKGKMFLGVARGGSGTFVFQDVFVGFERVFKLRKVGISFNVCIHLAIMEYYNDCKR
jgi:hypothetical protein